MSNHMIIRQFSGTFKECERLVLNMEKEDNTRKDCARRQTTKE